MSVQFVPKQYDAYHHKGRLTQCLGWDRALTADEIETLAKSKRGVRQLIQTANLKVSWRD